MPSQEVHSADTRLANADLPKSQMVHALSCSHRLADSSVKFKRLILEPRDVLGVPAEVFFMLRKLKSIDALQITVLCMVGTSFIVHGYAPTIYAIIIREAIA